ncbi:hypothetical protein X975_16677, partial [Stegodyphus mimosarum]
IAVYIHSRKVHDSSLGRYLLHVIKIEYIQFHLNKKQLLLHIYFHRSYKQKH